LATTLRELEAEGLAGVSLTMPLKRAVVPMLSRAEALVAEVGAANTVLFGGVAGEWWGANTDVPGMVLALQAAGVGTVEPSCVLGGGATAASALAALRELGDVSPTVVVRRLGAINELRDVAGRLGVAPQFAAFDDAAEVMRGSAVVVSTTPAGATDALADRLPPTIGGLLFDVVYAPWPTALATAWSGRGGRVVGGLELLVEQAAVQVRLMTGKAPPVEAMRAAGEAALQGPAAS
jgi:shikimate dehydrogenase